VGLDRAAAVLEHLPVSTAAPTLLHFPVPRTGALLMRVEEARARQVRGRSAWQVVLAVMESNGGGFCAGLMRVRSRGSVLLAVLV